MKKENNDDLIYSQMVIDEEREFLKEDKIIE